MKWRAALGATLAVAAVGGGTSFAGVATIYVDQDSRGGACTDDQALAEVTIQHPLCTIGAAVSLAPAGSRVLVRQADYPGVVMNGVRETSLVTFAAYPGEKPALNGLDVRASQNLRFEGFRVTDVSEFEDGDVGIQLANSDLSPYGIVGSGSQMLFENNNIHNLTIKFDPDWTGPRCNFWYLNRPDVPLTTTAGAYPRCGFGFMMHNLSDSTIRGNHISYIPADGIQVWIGDNLVISGNEIDHVRPTVDPLEHSDGIQLLDHNAHDQIVGNSFHDLRGIIAQKSSEPNAEPPSDLLIQNNVFYRLTDFGALSGVAVVNLKLLDNTVWTTGKGFKLVGVSPGTVIQNNITTYLSDTSPKPPSEDYNLIMSGYRKGKHDLAKAPRFANAAAGNFHLLTGSAGINAGTALWASPFDKDGKARVGVPDMGAYEFRP